MRAYSGLVSLGGTPESLQESLCYNIENVVQKYTESHKELITL